MLNTHLLVTHTHQIASLFASVATHASAASVPAPPVDTTGTNTALENLAKWGAGLATGFIMLALVWHGLQYMWTHDLNRSTQLKIAAAGILGGVLIVLLAVNLAPEFMNLILNSTS